MSLAGFVCIPAEFLADKVCCRLRKLELIALSLAGLCIFYFYILFTSRRSSWTLRRGTLGICGVAVLRIFLCGVAVKKIPARGVAVVSGLAVCDVCILKSTVFGEKNYLRYSRFHNLITNKTNNNK